MGYTYKFKVNESYGASDVNGILSRLTTSGVSLYTDGIPYDPSDLDEVTATVVNAGVSPATPAQCKVSLLGTQAEIAEGTVFYADGSVLVVDSGKVQLPLDGTGRQYIYAKKDAALGTGYPIVSTVPPGSYDVPLAEYDGGAMTDKRVYAVSKTGFPGRNLYDESVSLALTFTPPSGSAMGTSHLAATITGLKRTNYKYVMIHGASNPRISGFVRFTDDLNGDYFSIFRCGDGAYIHWTDPEWPIFRTSAEDGYRKFLWLKRVGTTIEVYIKNYDALYRGTPINVTLHFA